MKTILYFIATLLILAGIPAASYVFYQSYINNNEAVVQEETQHLLTRDEVIGGITTFLNTAQGTDGSFPLRFKCELGRCEPMASAPEAPVGWSILGLLAGSSATGDQNLKSSSDKAMGRVLRLCESDPRVCTNNFFAIAHYYDLTKDPAYAVAIDRASDHIRETVANWPEELILRPEMNSYIKLEKLYEYYQEEQDRDMIIAAAEVALKQWPSNFNSESLYSDNDYSVGYIMPYVATGIFLPAYRLSGDERYLNAAREFFSLAVIDQHLAEFSWEGGMFMLFNSIEGMLSLSQVEKIPTAEREVYISRAQNIMRLFVEFQYDDSKRPVLDGTYGLRTGQWTDNELPGVNYKNINLNGWAAYLLAQDQFADIEFNLVPSQQ